MVLNGEYYVECSDSNETLSEQFKLLAAVVSNLAFIYDDDMNDTKATKTNLGRAKEQ